MEPRTGKRWHREDFLDAWSRYVPSNPKHPQQPDENTPQPAFSNPQQEGDVAALKNARTSTNSGTVAGVAGSDSDLGDECVSGGQDSGLLEVLDL